jgi:hypothetical protein
MNDVRVRLAELDADTRAIAARFWRAHHLPRADELDHEQTAIVHEWLDWMLHEGEGWPTREPVEIPPLIEYPVMPPAAPVEHFTIHVCGEVIVPYWRRYERWLGPHDACEDCGWSPALPLPSLEDTAVRLVEVLGRDDAARWVLRLLVRLRESKEVAA